LLHLVGINSFEDTDCVVLSSEYYETVIFINLVRVNKNFQRIIKNFSLKIPYII